MRNSRKLLASLIVAVSVAAIPVYAAMAGDKGSCDGHKGGHGHGDMSMSMGIFSKETHDKLQLNATQEQAWAGIESRAEAQRTTGKASRDQVQQVFAEEMAKAEPDLARVAAAKNAARDSKQQTWAAIEAEQLSFYASLSPQQKGVVKQVLTERMEHKGHHGKPHGDKHHGDEPKMGEQPTPPSGEQI